MTAFQAIFTAILQGITELFPVSSLGHAVILPGIFGWDIDQHAPNFLPFLVVLHLGTAAALLIYFWRDWIELLFALLGRPTENPRSDSLRLIYLIIVATIPAAIIGFAFQNSLRHLFGVPAVAAIFLVVNGFVLFAGERLRRRVARNAAPVGNDGESGFGGLPNLSWRGALMIGLWQCTALIPGISRSGATMVGGLLAGLHHKDSARFSFLIATPIICGAAVLEVPKLLHSQTSGGITGIAIVAGIVAGVTAYASIAFLMRYFRKHDFEALDPFAWYCWVAGVAALGWLYFR
jgi:undecaprenyl-diphosphatase